MSILVCFVSCSNGSSDSGGSQGSPYDINYSLGNPPAESLSFENLGLKFSAKEDSEGIYLEFDYPKSEDYWRTIVYVEGLGTIAEEVQDFDTTKTKGCFFYPFVDVGKEYAIRFVSFANEKKDENGFVINGDTVLAWFETKVTAGVNSKGEVKFTSKGEIFVDKRGNFRFTKRPTFQNEKLLGDDWVVEIGLVEGISWAHGDERKTYWHGSVQIPQADLLKQINFFEELPWLPGIDFICVRPVLENYEHNGKKYRYQWDGFVEDIFYPSKADRTQTININNPQDVAKIQGTWKRQDYWENEKITDKDDESEQNFIIFVNITEIETMNIDDDQKIYFEDICTFTKTDDTAFTKKELAYIASHSEPWHDLIPSSEVDAFEKELNKNTDVLKFEKWPAYDYESETAYQYYIYKFDDEHYTLSSDKRTLIGKYDYEHPISEYFKDQNDFYDKGYTRHYELKLFQDGRELQVLTYGTDEDGYYEYTEIYNRQ